MRATEILTELRGIKADIAHVEPDAGHDTWQNLLAQHGFTAIGQGYHGQVYAHAGLDYVLKVFTRQDTAYQTWVGYCRGALLGNPYVPVFRGGIVRINADTLATRMERLSVPRLAHMETARQLQRVLLHSRREKRDWTQDPYVQGLDDQLIEVLGYIDAAGRQGFMLDLKGNNVMSRGDQMVIIDPLA